MKCSDDLKLLTVISNYTERDKFVKELQNIGMPINFITHGHGSANSEILEYLGIAESKKIVIFSIIPDQAIEGIFNKLKDDMNFEKKGYGISFVCDVTSMSSFIMKMCSNINIDFSRKKERDIMDNKYELVFTIVTKGNFDEVMEAAKSAGATGGTLIHASGLGTKESEQYLGITIQPEKDIVLIVAQKDKKKEIMSAITDKTGLNTEGKGICFSVPIEDTLGIGR